jgi:hypothetical protein
MLERWSRLMDNYSTSSSGGSSSPNVGGVPEIAKPDVPQDAKQDLMTILKKDFNRLKAQKARPTGGVEGNVLTNLCFFNDEHYVNYTSKSIALEKQESNKLNLTFNLITPRVNKLIGRLSAFNAPFKARPNKKDPQALHEAEIVDRMIIALDEKLDEPSRMRERLFWANIGGVAVEFVPWIPNATAEPAEVFENGELMFEDTQMPGQPIPESQVQQIVQSGQSPIERFKVLEEVQPVGEVGSFVYGPLNFFIDQNVRSVQDLPPGSWCHLAEFKTIGWIEENYQEKVTPQKDLTLITSRINAGPGDATGGVYLKDLIPMVQGSCDDNDPEMVLHVQSWMAPNKEFPKGRYACWIPDQKILHEAENPYEEIPFVDFHWSPATTSFWSKSYVTPLIAPQRFINKRMSQLGEQANATIYSTILLGPGLKAEDIPPDFPGAIENGLNEDAMPNVGRMSPPEFPTWFIPSIELAVKMFNDAAGGADLMEESKFPGQLRGPMAVPMLQEIIDTQWGPLFNHLGERLARVKQMRLNRVKQFYPPSRTMHYTDKTQKDEVLTFHAEKILRGGTNFSITVERGAILPELRALRESRVMERLSGPLAILYMDQRTGQLDKGKIAADLQFGDTGREGRESLHRKLAIEIIKMLWEGGQVPPVQPFYDHQVFLDELEAAMTTTEFMKASPQIQQAFSMRWQEHNQYLQQAAQAQAQMMQSQQIHSAVAQATQMAAAKAASEAVDSVHMQNEAQKAQPTEQYVAQAQSQSGGGPTKPQKPTPKKTKMTIERSS